MASNLNQLPWQPLTLMGASFANQVRAMARALIVVTACLGTGFGLAAATVQEIYSFPGAPEVQSSLVEGSDGAFYGTTFGAGAQGLGSVFRVTTNGSFTTLVSFDGTNGAMPSWALVADGDGAFYGTTLRGGTNDFGMVFRVTQEGALTNLVALESNPPSITGLFHGNDGALYGTSYQPLNSGLTNVPIFAVSIFSVSSNRLSEAASFTTTNHSNTRMIQANDGAFYGTTEQGGSFSLGSVFRVTANEGLITLVNFDGTNGSYPSDGLVQGSDGRLFGTTQDGGSDDLGVFFALTTGGELTNLVSFNDNSVIYPSPAALIQGTDGAFYGTTLFGGDGEYGTVFRVTTNGELTVMGSFDQTNGSQPRASVVEGTDGAFYGTTYYGGAHGYGTVFRVTPAGQLTSLMSFTHPDAVQPAFGLVQGTNGDLYGTTYLGGTNNAGTIFRITTHGVEKTLISFQEMANSSTGPLPSRLVKAPDGNFYGTTRNSGTNGFGTVFQMTEDGRLTTIATFDGTNGTDPFGGLLYGNDGAFYGTTENGTIFSPPGQDSGTVFRVTTNGEITTLAQFAATNGASPNGDLAEGNDGAFYGTTTLGGSGATNRFDGGGTVFRATTNGELTMLVSFNGTNGAWPRGGLVQGLDDAFYGTTSKGGAFDLGTVFRITTNGDLTTLLVFTGANGARPVGGLIRGPGGAFYGTTSSSDDGGGTLFRITTNGVFTTVASFDYSTTGAGPVGRLLLGQDGALYGTAADGGSHGGGAIFRLSLASQMQPLTRAGNGWVIGFSGVPGQTYRLWRATNLSGPWETLATVPTGADGCGQYTDSSPPSDKAFYRVESP
jgi:uncharacterized repeat protein (TIGR03803 family)